MAISFDLIPSNLRVPGAYTEIDSSQAITGVQLLNMRYLLIGQITSEGTATPNQLVRVTSVQQARELAGPGSMLALMVEAAIASNNWSDLWILPIEDSGAGQAAEGHVIFGGPVTAAGTLSLYIDGRLVEIGVDADYSAPSVAGNVVGAINADPNLPVTAAVNGSNPSRVDITAKNAGEAGNDIDIRLGYFGEKLPGGLTAAIMAMSGGTGNPNLTDPLAALGDEWFHIFAMPYTDTANLSRLELELDSRFGPLREIEGHAFAAARGSVGTLGTLGAALNSKHLTVVAAQGEPMAPYEKAAETAAIACYYATIDPARPLQTLQYTYCKPPAEAVRFTLQERNVLLYDGIATTTVDAGGIMRVERLVTTYKTNAAGGPDEAYLDVETLFNLMTIRHDAKARWRRKYPRHKLADDGTRFGDGQAVVTPGVAKAELVSWYGDWEELGLVEDTEGFKDGVITERTVGNPNSLSILAPVNVINGLRVIKTKIQFRL